MSLEMSPLAALLIVIVVIYLISAVVDIFGKPKKKEEAALRRDLLKAQILNTQADTDLKIRQKYN